MSTNQPRPEDSGAPSRKPEPSQSFPNTPARRRPRESDALPASNHAVSQADGAA
jgi:hypothetical protein